MARKFALLWNATESADTESQYSHAEWSFPLRLAGHVSHFGVIAPLALFGVWATWARRDQLWLLYVMGATYAASVMMFFVFTRYRYPLVPFLILFASAGLVDARRLLREPERRASSMRRRHACAGRVLELAAGVQGGDAGHDRGCVGKRLRRAGSTGTRGRVTIVGP